MQNRLVINLNNIIGKYSYIINQVYYTLVLLETLKTDFVSNFKSDEYFKFSVTSKNEIVLDIAVSKIQQILIILTKHTVFRFNKLSDIAVYDRPQYDMRFIINYVLGNAEKEHKIRIRTWTYGTYVIPTIVNIINSASWAEREALDMYGIKFFGHPDLRRILSDYGLWGFPGRKDFPMVGHYSYFFSLRFLRVFMVRGCLEDFWSIYFQKKLYKNYNL